jgi:DNA-binding MarR family transcriptional regulator
MSIAELAEAIERLTTWSRRQTPLVVSSTTITTLDTLQRCGPLRISDLARREGVSQPGMTSLVNRLEAAGRAKRITDRSDGRATLVRITDAGRGVLAERRAARSKVLQDRLRELSPEHRDALMAAAPAMAALTETETETTAHAPVPAH